jgi:hypothetical protein
VVQDYPSLGYQSGQCVHGYKGCVECKEDTTSRHLIESSKVVTWVNEDGCEWKTHGDKIYKELFDNIVEIWPPPCKQGGKEIKKMIENWD